MNANRLISMAVNMILRRLMRGGINAGVNAVANRNKGQAPGQQGQAAQTRKPGPDTREAQQRMRHMVRLGRRMGRF